MIQKKAFSLIELSLTISLLAIIGTLSIPVCLNIQRQAELTNAANNLASFWRQGQHLSQAMANDARWGVKVGPSSITLFQGLSFSLRDSSSDQVVNLAPSVTPSNQLEVVFDKYSGLPDQAASVILTSSDGSTKTVNLNSLGLVSFL